MLLPGQITRTEFDEALGRYPALINSISISKTRKYLSEHVRSDAEEISGQG
jgi:hypothetical protein